MKNQRTRNVTPIQPQIIALANLLWEHNGCQPARDWDYWLQAECVLRSARLSANAVKTARLMILK